LISESDEKATGKSGDELPMGSRLKIQLIDYQNDAAERGDEKNKKGVTGNPPYPAVI
jgi:hypothetical protein